MDPFLAFVEHSDLSEFIRGSDSLLAFPTIITLHAVGMGLLAGGSAAIDLRILGVSKRLSVRLLARHLLPWSLATLLLIVPTGVMMFASEATDLVDNGAFVVKMVLLMLAGTNAAAFHLGVFRSAALWDQNAPSPTGAKLHAVASLVIWMSVITCGRMIAYL